MSDQQTLVPAITSGDTPTLQFQVPTSVNLAGATATLSLQQSNDGASLVDIPCTIDADTNIVSVTLAASETYALRPIDGNVKTSAFGALKVVRGAITLHYQEVAVVVYPEIRAVPADDQDSAYLIHGWVWSDTAPLNPRRGRGWVNSSQTPPTLSVWNGSSWELFGDLGGGTLVAGQPVQPVREALSEPQAQQDLQVQPVQRVNRESAAHRVSKVRKVIPDQPER